jgi:hypothetical protein
MAQRSGGLLRRRRRHTAVARAVELPLSKETAVIFEGASCRGVPMQASVVAHVLAMFGAPAPAALAAASPTTLVYLRPWTGDAAGDDAGSSGDPDAHTSSSHAAAAAKGQAALQQLRALLEACRPGSPRHTLLSAAVQELAQHAGGGDAERSDDSDDDASEGEPISCWSCE